MISIHAPAKGATPDSYTALSNTFVISIHAPAKGATLSDFKDGTVFDDFNPRSREGSDLFFLI